MSLSKKNFFNQLTDEFIDRFNLSIITDEFIDKKISSQIIVGKLILTLPTNIIYQ